MSTPRVLFVAYHYPPENTIGAARPFRFAKYLAQHGYACHVLTAADVTRRPDLSATYIPDRFLTAPAKGIGFQIERAVRKLLLPGTIGTQWSRAVYHAGLDFVRQHPGDPITLFSTFPPVGVHAAGYMLARKTRLPWIADFRDPMGNNPINNRLGSHTRALYLQLEKRIVNTAAAVLANTDSAESILKRHYSHAASKIHLMWNGFDPEHRITALPLPQRPYRLFTHTGELYEGRTITPILFSVKRLIDAGRLAPSGIRISLIGPLEPHCVPTPAFLRSAQAAGWLSVTPRQIPKADAQITAQISDGLLIVQPQSAVQVPGKLFEYLQIGRPVLALVPPDSAIERLLGRAGVPFRCLYTSMPEEAFDTALLEYLNLPATPTPANGWFEETFNAANQTASLASLIRTLNHT
jgi:hypothetical protein